MKYITVRKTSEGNDSVFPLHVRIVDTLNVGKKFSFFEQPGYLTCYYLGLYIFYYYWTKIIKQLTVVPYFTNNINSSENSFLFKLFILTSLSRLDYLNQYYPPVMTRGSRIRRIKAKWRYPIKL